MRDSEMNYQGSKRRTRIDDDGLTRSARRKIISEDLFNADYAANLADNFPEEDSQNLPDGKNLSQSTIPRSSNKAQ